MRFLSLFAGAGGLDLGLDAAGWECSGQAELDELRRGVLARRWPDVRRWSDVRDVGADAGRPELVAGGFPCQDVSRSGARAGLAGERSGLWWEFARVVDALRPRAVLVENVEDLLGSNGGADLGAVVDSLVVGGYGVAWRVLDAQHFGLPQRRRRVFLLACSGGRAGAERSAAVLALTPGGSGDPVPRPWEGAGDRPAAARRAGAPRRIIGALTGRSPARLDDACVGGGQLVESETGVRRLTPVECERLMGWPDGHTERTADGRRVSDLQRYRMTGDGVAAPVAEWIGARLAAVLTEDLHPTKGGAMQRGG